MATAELIEKASLQGKMLVLLSVVHSAIQLHSQSNPQAVDSSWQHKLSITSTAGLFPPELYCIKHATMENKFNPRCFSCHSECIATTRSNNFQQLILGWSQFACAIWSPWCSWQLELETKTWKNDVEKVRPYQSSVLRLIRSQEGQAANGFSCCSSCVSLILQSPKVRGSLATLPIGHLRPYPPKTHKRVTCDPTSFYCAGHTKLDLVTCDPTHPY